MSSHESQVGPHLDLDFDSAQWLHFLSNPGSNYSQIIQVRKETKIFEKHFSAHCFALNSADVCRIISVKCSIKKSTYLLSWHTKLNAFCFTLPFTYVRCSSISLDIPSGTLIIVVIN